MNKHVSEFGQQLRAWRQRRRLSQLDLACDAGISTRHLSFMETGRARPSREMVLRLSDYLDVPLRQRNVMLTAGGFAPVYPERPLDDPSLEPARKAVELVLEGYHPYPALAVDRHWNLVRANRMVQVMLQGVAAHLLEPPCNVLRLSLHPEGLAPRIANMGQWRGHILHRLRQQIDTSGDTELEQLHDELSAYPMPEDTDDETASFPTDMIDYVVPMLVRSADGRTLSLFSTTTMFGTPVDVTLSEIAIEAFLPADAATAEALRQAAEAIST
ncbi:MAG: helix-turn-helix transcriptional regulator [Minwuia sp.]|nr:helix-turn-helix transcriptional regulator [Minwuia sp.]